MAVKPAEQMLEQLRTFLPNARRAIAQFEELERRFASDADFCALWESDSAAALRSVGIDPEARTEMGFEPYEQGPRCDWCLTPKGAACHC